MQARILYHGRQLTVGAIVVALTLVTVWLRTRMPDRFALAEQSLNHSAEFAAHQMRLTFSVQSVPYERDALGLYVGFTKSSPEAILRASTDTKLSLSHLSDGSWRGVDEAGRVRLLLQRKGSDSTVFFLNGGELAADDKAYQDGIRHWQLLRTQLAE